jgi:hypothetical protein
LLSANFLFCNRSTAYALSARCAMKVGVAIIYTYTMAGLTQNKAGSATTAPTIQKSR